METNNLYQGQGITYSYFVMYLVRGQPIKINIITERNPFQNLNIQEMRMRFKTRNAYAETLICSKRVDTVNIIRFGFI